MNGQFATRVLPAILTSEPEERLAALFDAHHERLYRLARRLTPSVDDALDLVQETYLRAARFPKSIPAGVHDEEAWLVRVLVNIRRDDWRKKSLRDRHDRLAQSVNSSGDAEAAVIAKTAVWNALDALPPRRRAIVVMCELEGLAIQKIAALLGISAITVRWHLAVGKRELKKTLDVRSKIRIAVLAIVGIILAGTMFPGSHPWTPFLVDLQAAVRLEVRLAEYTPAPGLREAKVSESGRTIYLHNDVIVTNGDIAIARIIPGIDYSVTLEFTKTGTQKIHGSTTNHIGKPLAFLINGRVIAAPVVRMAIDSSAALTGKLTKAEAERIANGLNGR